MNEKLLTAKQVAELLQVSTSWVFQHARGEKRPTLPCLKLGGSLRFDPAAVRRFLDECQRQEA